jgi:hypothetical protein
VRRRIFAKGNPRLINIYMLGTREVHSRLLKALEAACALRIPHSVTTLDVRDQLASPPDPLNEGLEWNPRSIGQALSTLADRGKILRVGMFKNAPGQPAVQHWLVDPRRDD